MKGDSGISGHETPIVELSGVSHKHLNKQYFEYLIIPEGNDL